MDAFVESPKASPLAEIPDAPGVDPEILTDACLGSVTWARERLRVDGEK